MNLFKKIFGISNEKELKRIEPILQEILGLEEEYSKLSDLDLKSKTVEFKERLKKGETLDDILPEAYATVREASLRVLGMKHYPVQIQGGIILHQGRIAELSTGEGKAVDVNTKIPTPLGWKKAGDISVGDFLFDRYGKPTKVVGVYPQGKKDTYKVKLKDGRFILCNEEHLWSVYNSYYKSKSMSVITTGEMIKKGTKRSRGYNFFLPINNAVEYDKKDFKIDPYVMGAFLGDGCKNENGCFVISGADEELISTISELIGATGYYKNPANFEWQFYNGVHMSGTVKGKNKKFKISDLDETFVDLLSQTYCYDKYIPEEYKLGSIEQRWALIQGLMDTDGNIDNSSEKGLKRYNLSFSTSSERMKNDFMEVIYSLGLTCSAYKHRKANEGNAKHDQYEIRINVPNSIKSKFFRLTRKKNIAIEGKDIVKKKNYSRIAIVDIQKLDYQTEQICFTVDNNDHLFLVGDYIVTHNTITSTLPVYLNALTGEGVHVVTVNDYLAKRDSQWMGKVYKFLGLSVGLIVHDLSEKDRRLAYSCDITYGTNNEIGFDYLRDNMVYKMEDKVQRGLNFAIIDEVDSILIDEARTPLIISGFGGESTDGYLKANEFVKGLKAKYIVEIDNGRKVDKMANQLLGKEIVEEYSDYDYIVEEKKKSAMLTERGVKKAEEFYHIENLSDSDNIEINHYITRAIKAYGVFKKDRDYVLKDGKVIIVDESTGRLMEGRRYSEGIHQAIEAKENVDIQEESKTLASITFQNFFRKYDKLSGMTGTAKTEEEEFNNIYNLDIVQVPTNEKVKRQDKPDRVYLTYQGKINAIVSRIKECYKKGQPILVGTISVEKSEELSNILKKENIKHNVLNAKYHEQESKIIAQAGRLGAVTIATNMAGRGTDILLGGNPEYIALEELRKEGYSEELLIEANSYSYSEDEDILKVRKEFKERENRIKEELKGEKEKVIELGGLYVLGTERHESRRIDNQLRGRSGRQGDVGVSEFILSLQDDLMRLFGTDKLVNLSKVLNIPENVPIDMGILSNQIEKAQQRIESQYFQMREQTLRIDDVVSQQRDIIYKERNVILSNDVGIKDICLKLMKDYIINVLELNVVDKKKISNEDIENIKSLFIDYEDIFDLEHLNDLKTFEEIKSYFCNVLDDIFEKVCQTSEDSFVEFFSKRLLLFLLDTYWQDHMISLEELKKGIGLQAYANKDPIQEFEFESFDLFEEMENSIREEVLNTYIELYRNEVLNKNKEN